MIRCSKKKRESYPGKCFRTKEKKNRLKFNPELALIGLRTTGPWGLTARRSYIHGSYSQEVLHVGVPVARGSYMQEFFCFVF